MDEFGQTTAPKGLIGRIKSILLKPKEEWPVIASESTSPGDLFTRYVIPLAAIGPVATLIGSQAFGYGAFGITYRPSLVTSITSALTQFLLAIVMVVAVGIIAEKLAPKFGGEPNRRQAFKWVAYGATASWVAGIFGLVPMLGVLSILGLYSLYLFYVGATPMMKVPEDRALGYTAVTVVCAIALSLAAGLVTSAVTGIVGGGAALISGATSGSDDDGEVSGTIGIPGLGSINVDEMEEAAERMERMANGEIEAVSSTDLAALLPANIGSYARTATESNSVGQMGSNASATYESGDNRFKLQVTDMLAMGGIAGMASAMNVEHSREDADGYERVQNIDGQMVTESWNNSSSRGTYGVMVDDRFMVQAEGNAANIDELKAAVATIDQGQLEELSGE
jgi:hypothetical protein